MSRKNDDSIEKFFRKAVRQSDTTFRESDWLTMEKMLEEEAQARAALRAKNFRRMATAASGILLMAVSVYFFMPNSSPQSTVDSPQSAVHPEVSGQASPQSTVRSPQPTPDNTQQPDAQTRQTDDRAQQITADDAKNTTKDSQQTATIQSEQNTQSANNATQKPTDQASVAAGSRKATSSNVKTTEQSSTNTKETGINGTTTRKPKTEGTTQPEAGNISARPNKIAKRQDTGNASTISTTQLSTTTASTESQVKPSSHVIAKDQPYQNNNIDPNTTSASSLTVDDEPSASLPRSFEGEQAHASQQGTLERKGIGSETPESKVNHTAAAKDEPHQNSADPNTKSTTVLTVDPGQPTSLPRDLGVDRTAAAKDDSHQNNDDPNTTSAAALTVDQPALRTRGGQSTVDSNSSPVADTIQQNSVAQEPATAQEPPSEPEEDDKPPIRSRWNAALVIAPDFSSTTFGGEMSSPGQAFGGLIGYRVSRRFTIVSGFVNSSKKYEGYGDDYQPPEGYWQQRTNGVVPDEIKGSCRIVEVPVIVQFDIKQGARSRLYVAGGISSYFMRHEEYGYKFHEPNAGAARGWASNTPQSYAFKIGHLSVAYELMLTNSLGVGIEPYIKIPLQGIGWPNISLYTTGAYINVRYFLLRKMSSKF